MRTCFVRGCQNSDKKKKRGVTFYSFSKKLQSEWLSAIGQNPNLHLVHQKICSEHFDVDDFERNGKNTRIKDKVIPTKNLPKEVYSTYYNTNNLSTDEMPSRPLLIMISNDSNSDDEHETENIILEYEEPEENLETKLNMKEESVSSHLSSELNSECILGLSSTFPAYRSTSVEHVEKGKTSNTWKYFTPQTKTKATCNFCQASLSYKTSISNLKKHMLRKHASIKTDGGITSENQETLTISKNEDIDNGNLFIPQASPHYIQSPSSLPSISTSQPTSLISQESEITQKNTPKRQKMQTTPLAIPKKKISVFDKKALDDELLKFITKDFQPLSIVDNVGFQEFTKALNPSYILPSRRTLSVLLNKKYEEVKINTKEMIESAKSVTITTDCWTSYDNDSFLAVTAHFLNDEFQMKSVILEVALCTVNSNNLAKELGRIATDWDLQNRILLCISDDTAEIKKAMSEELQWDHLGCLAHTINLIVQDALEVVQPLVKKISDIVFHFKRTTVAKTKLDFCQKQNGKDPKKLIQSVCTTWNFVYYMLQRIMELKEEVRMLLTDFEKENWPILSDHEFEIIDELINILDPMESTIKIMSSEEQVTLSLVIIITNGLQDIYKQFSENNTFSTESKSVLQKIANGISIRLKNMETSTILLVTTFLDPRFKHIGFSSDSSVEKAKALVTDALTVLIEEKRTPLSHQPAFNSSINQTPGSAIWSLFEKKISSFTPSDGNQRSKAIIEIQRYIDQPLLDRTEDPMNWWKDNSLNFPYLSQLAKLKFGVVATSVPCERIFTKAGQLRIDRRNLLSENEVKQIMFIEQNSK